MDDWLTALGGTGSIQAFFLLSLRVAAVFVMTPIFYAAYLPPTIRALLLTVISGAVAVGLAPLPISTELTLPQLFGIGVTEVAFGSSMGLGILLAFGAFSVAGNLLDIQVGFGIGQVVDPMTRRPLPVLTTAFQQFALLFFFVLNGHHALLRGVAFSLERFPVGAAWPEDAFVGPLLKQVGTLFTLGFALVAPVVFCILMVELALGVVARNLPQMNMFAMGIPIKVVVCLTALSFWFTGIGSTMDRVYSQITRTWDAALSQEPIGRTDRPPTPPVPGDR